MGVAEVENLLKKSNHCYSSLVVLEKYRLLWKTFHASLVFQAKALDLGGLPEIISVWAVKG